MDGVFEIGPAQSTPFNSEWVPRPGSAAIIVDLPGEYGVLWGIELARLGYRPIPLYNALPFPPAAKVSQEAERPATTVDVESILAALMRETDTLKQIALPANAPPAFLLDADRLNARIDLSPGVFDNRSVCFSTDFPTAQFLFANGIRTAIILQRDEVRSDLMQALLPWQQSGIEILQKNTGESLCPVVLKKPSFLERLVYKLSVWFGLKRGELGFGGIVASGSG